MNIRIQDFTPADLEEYLIYAIDEYAKVNIKSGRWTSVEAKTKSQQQYDSLLKNGLKSEGHSFWSICLDGKKVGLFWFHRHPKDPEKIFVYDTRLEEGYRNQGIGTSTFSIIRERLKDMGIKKIGLNVFANNKGAIRLYERLGFIFTSFNMQYNIED